MAMSDSFMAFSMPFTTADIATRLLTPRMMPSMVSIDRNRFAQISLNPTRMALNRNMLFYS